MNMFVFIGAMVCLALISLVIGYRTSDSLKTKEDYYLGSRKLGFFSLSFTLLATQLGGGAIVGSAEAAFRYGWKAIYYSMGLALGLFLLSSGVGAKFRNLGIGTVSEIFSKIYGSPFLRKCSSLISILSLFFILVAIGVSARKFFYSIGVESNFFFFAFWSLAILYTVAGGLNAVVKTDLIQVLFILFVFLLITLSLPFSENFSMPSSEVFERGGEISLLSWLVTPFLFILISQDMGQRCFSAKSPSLVSRSTFFAGILLLAASLFPMFLGVYASAQNWDMDAGASVLIAAVLKLSNPSFAALFAAAVLMAILSTADSLICAISSNLSLDFPIFGERKYVAAITFLVGVFAMVWSSMESNIIPMMVFAYELSVCAMLVPAMGGLFIKNISRQAGIFSFFAGIFTFVLLKLFKWDLSIPSELLPLLISAIVFSLCHFQKKWSS